MATTIQLRRDTAAHWSSTNPILASGEIGLQTDTAQFKIGDGITHYNSLPLQPLQGPVGPAGPGLPYIWKRKLTDQNTVSNITPLNDDTLFFPVLANQVWIFEIRIRYDSATTPDINFSFSIPVGATISWNTLPQTGTTTGATLSDDVGVGNMASAGGGVGTIEIAMIKGIIIVAGTGGNVQLKWAQNSNNSNTTTVRSNSYLLAYKVEG